MTLLGAALAIAAFVIFFRLARIVPAARGAMSIAHGAIDTMRDRTLADAEKEVAVQKAALAMLGAAFSIFWRVGVTLLGTSAPIVLLDLLGLADGSAVIALLSRPEVIVGASLVVAAALWLGGRIAPGQSAYSPLDRALHRLAFAAPFVQRAAADMEDRLLAREFADTGDQPPIFITSLPRAGTTVVLNALHDVPGVATHLYRDMPFVMAPLLWSRLSAGFARQGELTERAHGDGLQIGLDSPEAFEEVIWRHFWPERYRGEAIALWTEADNDSEAAAFLRRHFRKIVALRTGPGGRYVSKNNGNIARLGLLPKMFPGARIVVPLRDPAEHAASLLRQHRNFAALHERDRFARRYMDDIGHLEFGALHRPVAFPGFRQASRGLTPDRPDYWLAYWLSAYAHVAEQGAEALILPERRLQAGGDGAMQEMCRALGIDPAGTDFGRHFKAIAPRADPGMFDARMLGEARELYAGLAGDCPAAPGLRVAG